MLCIVAVLQFVSWQWFGQFQIYPFNDLWHYFLNVGLVTGAYLSNVGHLCAMCVDEKEEIPIIEPSLEETARCNHAKGRLAFTNDATEEVRLGEDATR